MRILYICADLGIPVLGRKGASVHVRAMVDAFAAAGHDVVLAAPVLNKSPWERPAPVRGRLLHVPVGSATTEAVHAFEKLPELLRADSNLAGQFRRVLYNDELATALRRRFADNRPDVIYERLSMYGTVGAQLASDFAVPLAVEVNAPLALEQQAYRGSGLFELASAAERYTASHAHVVAPVSEQLRAYVAELGVGPERIEVIPNGVDTEVFHPGSPDEHRQRRWGPGPVVGFVGNLRAWHGVDVLPRMVEQLRSDHPDVRMVVAGDGPMRPTLQREAEELGIGDSFMWLGSVDHADVPGIIRSFDVALAPYPSPADHGFYFSPLKVFEYLACGIPTVCPSVGQIPQLFDGEDGVVMYPAGDLTAAADAVSALLRNPSRREALGANGARLMAERFTWHRNATRVLGLLRPS